MLCPRCGSLDVRGGRIATDDRHLYVLMSCKACKTIFDAYSTQGAGPAELEAPREVFTRRVSLMGIA